MLLLYVSFFMCEIVETFGIINFPFSVKLYYLYASYVACL